MRFHCTCVLSWSHVVPCVSGPDELEPAVIERAVQRR